ncbi:MAG: DUF1273 family protein [Oscillospiraceae bacterium]|nr:DUF1273 family protein [Oscillospiraceae bacterium]
MRQPACTFTGHRASKLPWGYDESDPRCLDLKQRIYDTAEAVYSAGFTRFICGMAEGCDLYFCEAVLRLREEHPEITVEAAVPFAGQSDLWPDRQRKRYQRLLEACDERTVLQEEYSPGCMMKRNRYMIDRADLLIACYDGKTGGTLNTMRYALEKNMQIIHLMI